MNRSAARRQRTAQVAACLIVAFLAGLRPAPAAAASSSPGSAALNRIPIRGKGLFMNGINVAWNNWGEDLTRYDSAVFGAMFRNLSAAGGNSVRWWMHCDGQATPSYDAQGRPTGMPEAAFANLGRMLDLAASHGILVMPVLWSFDMANRNHANLVTDTAATNGYIRTVLDPLVRRYRGHPGLLAWEICNEPEWMLDDDGSTTQRVTKAQLQRFHGLLAAAIRRADPGALVTTGSASFKWSSAAPEAKGNYYSDQALRTAAGGDSLARLDFYQVHYYSWMRGSGWTYSPWDKGFAYWGLDKPVVIGELPAKGQAGYLDPVQMHVGSVDSGYAGVMSWAYLDNRADKEGAWADAKPGIEAVYARIPDAIRVPASARPAPLRAPGGTARGRWLADARAFALPGIWGSVEVTSPDGSRVAGRLARGSGETVWTGAGRVPPGQYLLRVLRAGEAGGGPGMAVGTAGAAGAFLVVVPE
jgi:hypothetical protein